MERKRKIIPPVYLFCALAFMWLLHRYFPVFQLIEEPLAYAGVLPVFFGISMAAISAVRFVKAEFPDDDGGKPTVMRYIIRDQAGMAEYWEGK